MTILPSGAFRYNFRQLLLTYYMPMPLMQKHKANLLESCFEAGSFMFSGSLWYLGEGLAPSCAPLSLPPFTCPLKGCGYGVCVTYAV